MLRTQFSKTLLKSHRVKACVGQRLSNAAVNSLITSRFVSDTTSATFRSIYEKGSSTPSPYDGTDSFPRRHLGPTPNNVDEMLKDLKESDLDSFIAKVVPDNVLIRRSLKVQPLKGFTESEMLAELARIAEKNKLVKPLIGKGFYGTIIPPVILRNLLENPGWYTSYTPYQPEVSQGRLESLLNFQTVISDLTGLPVANASLLDESSAAAEAMILSFTSLKSKKPKYFVDSNMHEQTLAVLKSRANTLNIEVVVEDLTSDEGYALLQENKDQLCGAMVQYPATDGSIKTFKAYSRIADLVHSVKGLYAVASDLMALTLLHAPSNFGADIVFGSSQRFGVPLGYGGPHAAFFSVVESLQRKIPGRIVGVSKDRLGNNALRLALQTREQHIKRERATSNICTAQALLANIAANYVVYHGIDGLRNISKRIHGFTTLLANSIKETSNFKILNDKWFDTLSVDVVNADEFIARALSQNFNVFKVNDSTIQLSLDETVTKDELVLLIGLFTGSSNVQLPETLPSFYEEWTRQDEVLTNEIFKTHRSETSMLRYLTHLQKKDISLADSMISLGSCTMKLNATVEMMPISWPKFANIHPFAPKDQVDGYTELITELEKDLADITGFHATTLQPNSGAQGEYTGLSVIAKYFESKGESHRNIVLIPVSAHGTNPASAAMAGLKVVPIRCLKDGSLDLQDLKSKASKHAKNLAAMMVTYPSTYGLFEPGIIDAIKTVHSHGGQVYLDGANMNAQVGLTSPGDLGADVCHLNLHKTFAIPHGGGGPGVGPICVKEHLTPFLPSHPLIATTNQTDQSIDPVVAAPFGSASILPISYAYIKMMGGNNLQYSSIIAILNANYMVSKLKSHYEILFTGGDDKYCGHEFIIDLRPFKKFGIEAIDVAKRLQDYGFHAPTMSFPIPGTLMVEPTESEYKEELDRFIDSMISIREEIRKVENGESDGAILHNSPHNLNDIISTSETEWSQRGYSREEAAYPLPFLKEQKTWPTVARVDDTYGDMNLLCTCPSVEEVADNQ